MGPIPCMLLWKLCEMAFVVALLCGPVGQQLMNEMAGVLIGFVLVGIAGVVAVLALLGLVVRAFVGSPGAASEPPAAPSSG